MFGTLTTIHQIGILNSFIQKTVFCFLANGKSLSLAAVTIFIFDVLLLLSIWLGSVESHSGTGRKSRTSVEVDKAAKNDP